MNMYKGILLAGLFIGGVVSLQASSFHTSVQTVMLCKDYDEVYDARGNLQNSEWYQTFEKKIKEGRSKLDKAPLVFSRQFVTTRVAPDVLQKMRNAKLIPKDYTGSIVQVCRMYHSLE
ncbi:hypothetical protein KC460_04540 [Candidatus Dependentiae bacterium]|nr:hypothetical protein [Candidatus Dependentiae bacterium]